MQAHAFFEGIDWQGLYNSRAPYVPRVEHELDTQNFENFDEQVSLSPTPVLYLHCSRDITHHLQHRCLQS